MLIAVDTTETDNQHKDFCCYRLIKTKSRNTLPKIRRKLADKRRGTMTNRERAMNILHYKPADRMPAVHFGYWEELLAEWADQKNSQRTG